MNLANLIEGKEDFFRTGIRIARIEDAGEIAEINFKCIIPFINLI